MVEAELGRVARRNPLHKAQQHARHENISAGTGPGGDLRLSERSGKAPALSRLRPEWQGRAATSLAGTRRDETQLLRPPAYHSRGKPLKRRNRRIHVPGMFQKKKPPARGAFPRRIRLSAFSARSWCRPGSARAPWPGTWPCPPRRGAAPRPRRPILFSVRPRRWTR